MSRKLRQCQGNSGSVRETLAVSGKLQQCQGNCSSVRETPAVPGKPRQCQRFEKKETQAMLMSRLLPFTGYIATTTMVTHSSRLLPRLIKTALSPAGCIHGSEVWARETRHTNNIATKNPTWYILFNNLESAGYSVKSLPDSIKLQTMLNVCSKKYMPS